MKKTLFAFFLVATLLVMSFSLVMAKNEKVIVEGEIIAVDEDLETITIQTVEMDEITIQFSTKETFSFTQYDIGLFVHVKGEYQEEDIVLASWVKPVDEVDDDNDDEKGESTYCSGDNEKNHPAAFFLAQVFDKDIAEITDQFCAGFGFGQISLALQTEKVTGIDYVKFLEDRAAGMGWGEIWQEHGFKDKPKDADKPPTDQDKDEDKDKTPPGQEKDKVKDKTPPGQDKDKDKDKDPDDEDLLKGKKKKPKKEK